MVGAYVKRLEEMEVVRWMGVPSKPAIGRTEVKIIAEGKEGKKVKMVVSKGKGEVILRLEGQDFVGVLERAGWGWLKQDPSLPMGKPTQR